MIRQLRTVLGPEHQADYTRFLIWATLTGALQGFAVSLLVPIARALVAGDWPAVTGWLWVLGCAVVCFAIAYYVQAMRGFGIALVVLQTMHLNIGDHLVTLPLGWFYGKTGSVSQIASKGTLAIGSAAAHLMTPVIIGISAPAAVTVSLFFIDWRFGLALLIAAPIIALGSRLAARLIARSDDAAHDAAAVASERVIEFARCQPVLRAFGRASGRVAGGDLAQGDAAARDTGGRPATAQSTIAYAPLRSAIAEQQRVARRSMADAVTGLALSGLVIQLVFTALVVLAAALALGGTLSGVDLLAILGVASCFIQPLREIAEFGGPLRQVRGELSRVQEIMDTETLPVPSEPAPLTSPGSVELDGVSFGYVPGTPVLRGLSFTAAPGTMTALVGPSGSGKTTVTRLIARFYEADAGSVRVGGVDVRAQRTEDLMAQLALVFQDVYLFDDTLRGNVRIGRPDASEADIDEAARLAGVTEIAERLPDGWNTMVGEAGSALSGGERQRVSVARAILKRAPIVLLDEATAALDPENERFVQHSLDTLRADTTLIVIAHKLSTVVGADRIIVLDETGSIAEAGDHETLLALGGRYAAFWRERSVAAGWRLTPGGASQDPSSPPLG